jgi:hypothetical protein
MNQARDLVHTDSELGKRLKSFLDCPGSKEPTVLLEMATPLDVSITADEGAQAERIAKEDRPDLVMWTDGSKLDGGAVGYAVMWRNHAWKV